MHRILKALQAILLSLGVALALCVYLVLKRGLFQGRVDTIEAGLLFGCAIAAFWILSLKERAQSRTTRRARELGDLRSVDDELVRLVQKNDAFNFIIRDVASVDATLHYSWVIQNKTFDFNAAIAKVKLRPGHALDEDIIRKQIKADIKSACGGWFLKPLVLGLLLETSASTGWNADTFIDHNYAGGIGIAWLIILDEEAMRLSLAHFPRSLRTTTFYDEFVSHLLTNGYALTNRSTEAAVGHKIGA